MAGRTCAFIRTQSSLDFELESKIGTMGPFTPTEWILVLMSPFVATGLTVGVLYPLIHWFGIVSIFFWFWYIPRTVANFKKNKSRSWMFDLLHRRRFLIYAISSAAHWRRPTSRQIYTGHRRIARSAWTRPKRAVFIPTKPGHLTLGLPRISVYHPQTKSLGPSITPQLRLDGYGIRSRVFAPGQAGVPESYRHCVIARDAQGRAAMQDYQAVFTRVTGVLKP